MAEPLVIIGKGMAATRLVEELSTRALGRYAIAVVGEEKRRAYNRVLLSSVLAGEMTDDEIELKPAAWWRDRGVTTLYGQAVTKIDRVEKRLTLADGTTLPYGKLVFATGSQPIRLPIPGANLRGVVTFRDHTDVAAMLNAARGGAHVVVVGGGLLGIEAAHGLARAGATVTLVHLMDRLMERQLDHKAAELLRNAIQATGIDVVLEAKSEAIIGTHAAEGLRLADGREFSASLIVLAAGIKPNAGLAGAAGLHVHRGIIVDDTMATSDPDIFALGECAEHHGIAYGLVEPAYQQAKVLAARLAGDASTVYGGSLMATNLKVSGVGVFSAGDFGGGDDCDVATFEDHAAGLYRKLVIRDGRLAGAVLFGDTRDALWFQGLIASGEPIDDIRDGLIFGKAIALSSKSAREAEIAAPVALAA